MSRGRDWPSNLECCAEGEHPYCLDCEPRRGQCVECCKPMCWVHTEEARLERRGLCTNCSVPPVPDDRSAPIHSFHDVNEERCQKKKTNAQILREKQTGIRKWNQYDRRQEKGK